MKKLLHSAATFILVCVPLCCTDAASQGLNETHASKPGLILEAKPTKLVFAKGEPVEILFTLKNNAAASKVVASHLVLTQNLSLEIRDSGGARLKWCGPILGQIDSRTAFKSLPVGGSMQSKMVVSCTDKNSPGQAWGYLVENPGSYTIIATYFLPRPDSYFKKLFPEARVDRGPVVAGLVKIEIQ